MEHLNNLHEILTRLQKAGMHFKKNECAFLLSQMEYLGHQISDMTKTRNGLVNGLTNGLADTSF